MAEETTIKVPYGRSEPRNEATEETRAEDNEQPLETLTESPNKITDTRFPKDTQIAKVTSPAVTHPTSMNLRGTLQKKQEEEITVATISFEDEDGEIMGPKLIQNENSVPEIIRKQKEAQQAEHSVNVKEWREKTTESLGKLKGKVESHEDSIDRLTSGINWIFNEVESGKNKIKEDFETIQESVNKAIGQGISHAEVMGRTMKNEKAITMHGEEIKRMSDRTEYVLRMNAELNKIAHDNQRKIEDITAGNQYTRLNPDNGNGQATLTKGDVEAVLCHLFVILEKSSLVRFLVRCRLIQLDPHIIENLVHLLLER